MRYLISKAPFGTHELAVPVRCASPDTYRIGMRLCLSTSKENIPNRIETSDGTPLPMCEMGLLGQVGHSSQVLSSHGPAPPVFRIEHIKDRHATDWSTISYPMLWRHNRHLEQNLLVWPDSQGTPNPRMDNRAQQIWQEKSDTTCGAGILHINRRFRANSQPLAACITPFPVIGGASWTTFSTNQGDDWDKALCAWLNTSYGLIARWWISDRTHTGRAMLPMSRVKRIPVPDLSKLSDQTVQAMVAGYNKLEKQTFSRCSSANIDPIRQELDQAILGDALNLLDAATDKLDINRQAWSSEPALA